MAGGGLSGCRSRLCDGSRVAAAVGNGRVPCVFRSVLRPACAAASPSVASAPTRVSTSETADPEGKISCIN